MRFHRERRLRVGSDAGSVLRGYSELVVHIVLQSCNAVESLTRPVALVGAQPLECVGVLVLHDVVDVVISTVACRRIPREFTGPSGDVGHLANTIQTRYVKIKLKTVHNIVLILLLESQVIIPFRSAATLVIKFRITKVAVATLVIQNSR